MIAQTWRSALDEVFIGRDLVPERVEPQPGLARVVPGLVHHSPLVTGKVLVLAEVGEVSPVGDEQERLGVVGPVELAGADAGRRPGRRSGPSRSASPSSVPPDRSARAERSGFRP